MSEFTPEQQAKVDEIVKSRIAREKERWEKESGYAEASDDLKAQLEAKDEEIATLKREHYNEDARRAVVEELASRGVTDEGRVGRILNYVDLDEVQPDDDGRPTRAGIQDQLADVGTDLPELLTYRVGAGSGGSKQPVLTAEKPITRDELEGMSPDEVNSRWGQVKAFLAGER